MLIVIGRESEGLYKGLKARQEAKGRDRVILDRRSGERRRAAGLPPSTERRTNDRRIPLSDAECALMKVLGFAVLQRELSVLSGDRIPRKPAHRATGRASTRIRERSRRKAAG
jgi:hypothetical protein